MNTGQFPIDLKFLGHMMKEDLENLMLTWYTEGMWSKAKTMSNLPKEWYKWMAGHVAGGRVRRKHWLMRQLIGSCGEPSLPKSYSDTAYKRLLILDVL